MNLYQIVKRELKQMFIEDRRRVNFIFGASLAYLFIFGLLYAPHVVKNVPIVICDEDQSSLSRELVQTLDDSERLKIILEASSEEEMLESLKEKKAYAAIHIPPDFTQKVIAGRSAPVLLMADGTNLVVTNTITTTIQEIIMTFSQKVSAKLSQHTGLLPTLAHNKTAPVQFNLRVLNNPTFSYLYFFVLGLAMAAFQQGIFLSTAASIMHEYNNPEELSRVHPLKVFLGKLLPYFILGTISFFLTLIVSIKVFDIPCKGSLYSLLGLAIAFILTAMGISSLIASLCRSEITFTRISLTYSIPAFTISGFIWPLQSMDAFNQFFAYTFPLLYVADSVRDTMLAGFSPLLARNIAVLSIAGISLILLSIVVYAHKRKELSAKQETALISNT